MIAGNDKQIIGSGEVPTHVGTLIPYKVSKFGQTI